MLLAIDAGNTNIVFAVFDGEAIKGEWRISTYAQRTADEYAVWLSQLMQAAGLEASQIYSAIAACVVPQALFELRMLCRRYFNTELVVIGDEGVKLGIQLNVDSSAEVGGDRVVNAYAAWSLYHRPLVVIDFGTATTFDVVNSKGEYIGGVIAPGVNLSLDALHRAAAKLPNVQIARPTQVIGSNTVSAMQSGIYYGYVGLIEGVVARIAEELGAAPVVVATGGLAPLYARATPVIADLQPDLTMQGLRALHDLNKGKI